MDDLSTKATGYWGMSALWTTGGPGTHLLLVVLAGMSLWSGYLILASLYDQQRWLLAARRFLLEFESGGSVIQITRSLIQVAILRNIAEAGLHAAHTYKGQIAERLRAHEWFASCLERSMARDQVWIRKDHSVLPTVALAAPVLGLLGTVYVLMGGLTEYAVITASSPVPSISATESYFGHDKRDATSKEGAGAADSPSTGAEETPPSDPDRGAEAALAMQSYQQKLAGMIFGILGQALIFLAIGLTVAAPAIVGHRWILQRSKVIEQIRRDFASELTARLLSGPLPPPPGDAGPDMASDALPAPVT